MEASVAENDNKRRDEGKTELGTKFLGACRKEPGKSENDSRE